MSVVASSAPEVVVSGPAKSWTVPLASGGLLIGRSEACGIVLDDRQVSGHHARIYQDPFDRWIVEDLQSHNGVWVDGRRVQSYAVGPGDRATIGPFTLAFSVPGTRQIPADETMTGSTLLAEGQQDSTQVDVGVDRHEALTAGLLRELDSVGECLAGVTRSGNLYPEACRCLAKRCGTIAVVVRVGLEAGASARATPQTLACEGGPTSTGDGGARPSGYRLSGRVIEAVRASGQAVMASNVRLGGEQLGLTVVDDGRPRAVYCAPITGGDDWTDLLYLEAPPERRDAITLDFVRAVARQVGFAARSILGLEHAAQIRQIDQQLAMAREIQDRLVPKQLDLSPAVDLALTYEPAFWVGGDYCDVWSLADGRIAFAVCDVMGKGLPAALVMTNLQAALRTAVSFRPEPAEVASSVSRHLKRHLSGQTFVTMVLGFLDPVTGRLEYLNAGHVLPLLVRSSGPPSEFGEPKNPPLGLLEATYVSDTVTLEPGTGLVVMTDGVTESRSPEGEMLGPAGVLRALDGASFASSEDLVRVVTGAASEFRGQLPAHDDLTVLALLRRDVSEVRQ